MRNLFLFCIVFLGSLAANAQTEKGTVLLGGHLGLTTGDKSNQFAFDPTVGFMVADNFMLGGRLSYNSQKMGNISITQFGVGPMARFFFGNTATKPFVVSEFDFVNSTTKMYDTNPIRSNGTRFLFGLGFAAFINNMVAVEGVTGYTYSKFKDVEGTGGFTLRLGFGIFFNNGSMKDLKQNVLGQKGE